MVILIIGVLKEDNENVEEQENAWEQVKRKKSVNKKIPNNPQLQETNTTTSQPLANVIPPKHTTPNPFEPVEDSFEPLSPRSPTSNPNSLALITNSPNPTSSPPLPLVDCILTRNKAKENPQIWDQQKKVGRKSNKEIRDEVAAKEMALGTQQPMETFLRKDTGSNEKIQLRGKGGPHQHNSK